ncbi:MAG: ATP synthase subunit I [Clostridiales bacterium]|uniref:ATP synthase subunit I n=1 Tax=Terrisporobacter sp. TaxID=1965305 RepID=UPI002A457861|nr:ATP synthase subunit I [Terrisporobacter sp.]MCI6458633.1 ATP synthase subunit I [Clostridium sp.]MDD5880148.1 ATP synthase subunit I [Clostridiales bacterium]MDY4737400.1 ATP synthase subunit I [Terrisporobacter sp.]
MDIKVQREVDEVTKGIIIYAIIISAISIFIPKETIHIMLGVVFGSVIAILNFRLLALTMEKAVDMSPGKAQAYTSMRYLVRMFIVAVVIFVSVKNPNINVIGTVLGLISTQIVIFIKKLLISKIQRKEVK